jgi:hypothetical protein
MSESGVGTGRLCFTCGRPIWVDQYGIWRHDDQSVDASVSMQGNPTNKWMFHPMFQSSVENKGGQ